jgi:hypothetical protein
VNTSVEDTLILSSRGSLDGRFAGADNEQVIFEDQPLNVSHQGKATPQGSFQQTMNEKCWWM